MGSELLTAPAVPSFGCSSSIAFPVGRRRGLPLGLRLPLVGQPTLRRRIKLGTFAVLDQRIALRFAMPAMTVSETGAYVAHHLKLAGRSDTLFSDDALALVHQVSRGLPRAVNNLALQPLVGAYAAKKAIVDKVLGPSGRHRGNGGVINADTMKTEPSSRSRRARIGSPRSMSPPCSPTVALNTLLRSTRRDRAR